MSSKDNPESPMVLVTLFADQSTNTRVGIAAIVILFLLFTYYLIGGYTNTCGCGSGEPYQNCGCSSHSYPNAHSNMQSHAHAYGNYPHVHQPITQPMTQPGSSNIYQAGPYLNF